MTSDSDNTITFKELSLPDALYNATEAAGFTDCTDIQALTLPHIIEGRDVAAQAQTGTGKTAAFLLGSMSVMLNRGDGGNRRPDQPRMVVIAPTRELAIQIGKDAEQLAEFTQFKVRVVYGGADYEKQRKSLGQGVDILVGTPGRLIDYHKKRAFDFKALEIVVLDEADRMFDLGFIDDIRFMLRRMPEPEFRISMLYSATLSHRVMELAYEHMNNPITVKTVSDNVTADGVRQQLFQPATDEKISLLVGLIRKLEPARTIVFVNTKRTAERIEAYLTGNDISCGTLSGDVRQSKRQRILADFTTGKLPILIATDVAARGLHIDDVTHVFNYDLPQQAEDYVHRIGRTARAGGTGEALSFACEQYSFSLPEIIEYIGQSIPTTPITDDLLPTLSAAARITHDRPDKPGRGKPSRSGGNARKPRRSQNPSQTSNSGSGGAARNNSEAPKAKSESDRSAPATKSRRRRRRKPSEQADKQT